MIPQRTAATASMSKTGMPMPPQPPAPKAAKAETPKTAVLKADASPEPQAEVQPEAPKAPAIMATAPHITLPPGAPTARPAEPGEVERIQESNRPTMQPAQRQQPRVGQVDNRDAVQRAAHALVSLRTFTQITPESAVQDKVTRDRLEKSELVARMRDLNFITAKGIGLLADLDLL